MSAQTARTERTEPSAHIDKENQTDRTPSGPIDETGHWNSVDIPRLNFRSMISSNFAFRLKTSAFAALKLLNSCIPFVNFGFRLRDPDHPQTFKDFR